MSYPCVDPAYFTVTSPGIVSPNRKWQWDQRANASANPAVFTPVSNAAGTVLQTAMATWVNTTGISQTVYGLMTYGGARIAIDGLKEPVIEWSWGTSFGSAPADPTLSEISRMRVKPDFSTASVSGTTVAIYYIQEERQPPASVPIGDMITLPAGQTVKVKAACRWLTLSWGLDYASIYGVPANERAGNVGGLRVDIFSMPVIP
jgi:hypothetical protein